MLRLDLASASCRSRSSRQRADPPHDPAAAHKRWPRAKVFLRFHIELDQGARGFGYVGMITGIGTSASAEFVPRRRRGRLVTSYNTVNVYGQRSYRGWSPLVPALLAAAAAAVVLARLKRDPRPHGT